MERQALTDLVLDFDGVIAGGTNRAYIETYIEAVRSTGLQLPEGLLESRILQHWGAPPRMELAGAMVEAPNLVASALAHYQRHIEAHLRAAAHPIEGAPDAIRILSRHHRLHIISGMGQAALDAIVRDFGLRDRFCHVISTSGSDDPSHQKRSGYHLRRLLAEEALDPRQVLSVGDAESDIAMARSCDVDTVAVLSGNLTLEAAQRLGVRWILPSLAALPQLITGTRVPQAPPC